jgi:hypothetical protein
MSRTAKNNYMEKQKICNSQNNSEKKQEKVWQEGVFCMLQINSKQNRVMMVLRKIHK